MVRICAGFIVLAFMFVAVFIGCDDADVASHNLSKAADNFEVLRRIVFLNGITDSYILVIEGKCSLYDDGVGQLEVVVKTGDNDYKKHYLGLSDNVTYFAEQLESTGVSKYHYRVTFKPSIVVPSIDIR